METIVSGARQVRGGGVAPSFRPCVSNGWVSLPGEPHDRQLVRILSNTASSQSLISTEALLFSDSPSSFITLRGMEGGPPLQRPVHEVHLASDVVNGVFPVAVISDMPVDGVDFLLGNDIAGGRVCPGLEAVSKTIRLGDRASEATRRVPPHMATQSQHASRVSQRSTWWTVCWCRPLKGLRMRCSRGCQMQSHPPARLVDAQAAPRGGFVCGVSLPFS